MTDRIARRVGGVLVGVLVGAFVLAPLGALVGGIEPPIDLGGTIERYEDDTLVVLTAAGLRDVQLERATRITDVDRAADARALRPGRFVAVEGERAPYPRPLRARRVIVWGAEQ